MWWSTPHTWRRSTDNVCPAPCRIPPPPPPVPPLAVCETVCAWMVHPPLWLSDVVSCVCRGSNAQRENQSPGVFKRVLLSQFPIGDQSTFRQTWAEVLSFLMAPVEGLAHPFWECMSAEQALDVVVNATYLAAIY